MRIKSYILVFAVIFSIFGCGGISEREVLKTETDGSSNLKLNSENFIDIARLYYKKDLGTLQKKDTNRVFSESRPLYPGSSRESVKQKDIFYVKSQDGKLTVMYNSQKIDVKVDFDSVKIVYDDGFKTVSEEMRLSDFVGIYSNQDVIGK